MEKDILKFGKKYFSIHNTLNFGILGNKIQHVLWRIQNLKFSNNSSIKYIFILSETNNLDQTSPEKLVNGIVLSGISAKKQCPNATIILNPLLPRSKKDSIKKENINITNRLLEEKSGTRDLQLLKQQIAAKCGSIT